MIHPPVRSYRTTSSGASMLAFVIDPYLVAHLPGAVEVVVLNHSVRLVFGGVNTHPLQRPHLVGRQSMYFIGYCLSLSVQRSRQRYLHNSTRGINRSGANGTRSSLLHIQLGVVPTIALFVNDEPFIILSLSLVTNGVHDVDACRVQAVLISTEYLRFPS